MYNILAGILSLAQHKQTCEKSPEAFRPSCCPSCGKSGLWRHGHYPRKVADGSCESGLLLPVAIPRFLCPSCDKTCSVLPECIPPRRHYLWQVQEKILLLFIKGLSYQSISVKDNGIHLSVMLPFSFLSE